MYKIDLHVHTSQTSPCGKMTAEKAVAKYVREGFGGIVITDHYRKSFFDKYSDLPWEQQVDLYLKGYYAAKEAGIKSGLRVYMGMELQLPDSANEYLIYGLTREILLENPKIYEYTLPRLRKFADDNGLAFFQAHPFRPDITPLTSEIVHGVEAFNGHFCHNSQNDVADSYASMYGLRKISGADCHDPEDVGNAGIISDTLPSNEQLPALLLNGGFELIRTHKQQLKMLAVSVGFNYIGNFSTAEYINKIFAGAVNISDIDVIALLGDTTDSCTGSGASDGFAELCSRLTSLGKPVINVCGSRSGCADECSSLCTERDFYVYGRYQLVPFRDVRSDGEIKRDFEHMQRVFSSLNMNEPIITLQPYPPVLFSDNAPRLAQGEQIADFYTTHDVLASLSCNFWEKSVCQRQSNVHHINLGSLCENSHSCHVISFNGSRVKHEEIDLIL